MKHSAALRDVNGLVSVKKLQFLVKLNRTEKLVDTDYAFFPLKKGFGGSYSNAFPKKNISEGPITKFLPEKKF